MDVLMESLGSLPESIIGGVQEQLYQALDEKLNSAIHASPSFTEIKSADDFDDLIFEVLSADDFVNEMVAVRDSILESYGDEGVEEN
jgi:alpha-D-ribose 1-methylphosphonate 5-phosphate C-P lyase